MSNSQPPTASPPHDTRAYLRRMYVQAKEDHRDRRWNTIAVSAVGIIASCVTGFVLGWGLERAAQIALAVLTLLAVMAWHLVHVTAVAASKEDARLRARLSECERNAAASIVRIKHLRLLPTLGVIPEAREPRPAPHLYCANVFSGEYEFRNQSVHNVVLDIELIPPAGVLLPKSSERLALAPRSVTSKILIFKVHSDVSFARGIGDRTFAVRLRASNPLNEEAGVVEWNAGESVDFDCARVRTADPL